MTLQELDRGYHADNDNPFIVIEAHKRMFGEPDRDIQRKCASSQLASAIETAWATSAKASQAGALALPRAVIGYHDFIGVNI